MEVGNNKSLTTTGLIMINVLAICSLRTLPFSAQFGWYLIPIYCLAAIGFLVPIALISSFLSTRYPTRGGVYIWVKHALGVPAGFLSIWLQWVYNLLWYPTAMIFVVNTLLHALHLPASANITLILTTALFWAITIANCFGMKLSSTISIFGALIGTIFPMALLVLFSGSLSAIDQLNPSNNFDANILPLLVNILFGLMGIEMSCVHAGEVKNPIKAYPRALLSSSIIIVLILMGSSLAISASIPHEQLSMIEGVTQAFTKILHVAGMQSLEPLVLICIALGGLACIGAWVIGPSKGLFVASGDGCLPEIFSKNNKHMVPQRLLILQACLVTLLNIFYWFMPSLDQAYEALSIATSQLALLAYLMLIFAAWKHRSSPIDGYELPGGRLTYKILCIVAFLVTTIIFFIGFQVPPSINVSLFEYDAYLIAAMLILMLPTAVVFRKYR